MFSRNKSKRGKAIKSTKSEQPPKKIVFEAFVDVYEYGTMLSLCIIQKADGLI